MNTQDIPEGFSTYVRVPFAVEAIQITEDNFDDVAPLIGEAMGAFAEKRIKIDRDRIPNMRFAYVGYWITLMEGRFRCYTEKAFERTFRRPDGDSITFRIPGKPSGPEAPTMAHSYLHPDGLGETWTVVENEASGEVPLTDTLLTFEEPIGAPQGIWETTITMDTPFQEPGVFVKEWAVPNYPE